MDLAVKRPYGISIDVTNLERRKPVTKILRSGSFRSKLEDVFRNIAGGKIPTAVRRLQQNVTPASRVESAILHAAQPNSTNMQRPFTRLLPNVIPVNDLVGVDNDKYSISEKYARCKLASLYRVIERMGWSFEIYNHISLRAPGEDPHFLINAFGLHYSEVTASNLVKVDLHGDLIDPGSTQLGISKAGYVIHSAIHEARKDIKCIIHLHTPHGAGVSAMLCGLLPLTQEALIVGGVSYHAYRGIVCDETEKAELAKDLGPVNKAMILQNHGLLAMGSTVEEAYHICMNLMAACEAQVMALTAGLNNVMLVNNDVAKKVFRTVSRGGGGVSRHGKLKVGELEYEAMMRVLDNLGYNTGYPYKNMDLLSPPEDSHRTTTTPSVNNSSHDTKHNMKEQQTGASDDISDVAKKIRREIRRIRNERQKLAEGGGVASQVGGGASKEKSRANITSREAQPIPSPNHVDLEYIARNSSGSTRPIVSGSILLGDPNNTMIGRSLPPSGHNSLLQTHGVGSYQNVDGLRLQERTTDAYVGKNAAAGSSSDRVKQGKWDFLEEREMQGPLPINLDHVAKRPCYEPESGMKPFDHQLTSHPTSLGTSAPRSLTPTINTTGDHQPKAYSGRHISWARENGQHPALSDEFLPTGIPLNPPRLSKPVSSNGHHSSPLLTTDPPRRSTPRETISSASSTVQTSVGMERVQPLVPNGNMSNHTDTVGRLANYSSGTTVTPEHVMMRHPDSHTGESQSRSSSRPHSYITLSPVKKDQENPFNALDHETLAADSNPSLTDLRAQTPLTKPLDTIDGFHSSHGKIHPSVSSSSKSTTNKAGLDLHALLKVEETAKAVANSTGKSVEKLSRGKQHQTTTNGSSEGLLSLKQQFTQSGSPDSPVPTMREKTLNPTNAGGSRLPAPLTGPTIDNDVSESLTVTTTQQPTVDISRARYHQLRSGKVPHDSDAGAVQLRMPSKDQSLYIYESPLLDQTLTGLEKAVNTAKKVAESTEKSVEKLSKSHNATDGTNDALATTDQSMDNDETDV